jgi:hypothetical protein
MQRWVKFERMRMFRMFGRRGLLLLMFGTMWIVFGVGVWFVPQARFSANGTNVPLLSLLDANEAGLIWAAAGSLAVAIAFVRKHRSGHDSEGFNALLAPPIIWLLGYIWSMVAWIATHEIGRSTAWVSAVVWLIVCVFIILIAGWPDPDDPAMRYDRENA